MVGPGIRERPVVGQKRRARLGRIGLLQFVEPVPHRAEQPLRLRRTSIGQRHDRAVEPQHVGIPRAAVDAFAEEPVGLGEIPPLVRRPHRLQPHDVPGAPAAKHGRRHHDDRGGRRRTADPRAPAAHGPADFSARQRPRRLWW